MPEKIIHIEWEGPMSVTQSLQFSGQTDKGIYQIYGNHACYGRQALLYIGKTSQTFAGRLDEHSLSGWESWQGRVAVHVGRLCGTSTPALPEWLEQIDVAEALLIVAHSPAYNKAGAFKLTTEMDARARTSHVLNWGDYGSLLPEVSGARWSSIYDDPPRWAVFGTHARPE